MSSNSDKKSFWSSFAVDDEESCKKAIRNGGIAATISAVITTIFGITGFFIDSTNDKLQYLCDPWILVDAVLIVVLAIFIFRKSRIASTLLVVYFVSSKLIMWVEMGAANGLIMTIIFLLYYITAMRAAYIWHSKYRDAAIKTNAEQFAQVDAEQR